MLPPLVTFPAADHYSATLKQETCESNSYSIHLRKNMMPVSIQIQRWLMQRGVWRFVGFVSAAVGLLSYALSSSFNHLFGEWNFSKIFLYFALSFIICFMTLFAKVWQFSTSVLFKAHMSVLILMATSVYSFFYDKAVNGKPDAYILISCFAFAVYVPQSVKADSMRI
ncbi:hypothetical protein RIF29_17199 [Crotalaria pallida]|uniref:Uncharacterized protein n=1 Tax=Crotalaria pallida TaxID=3830 RepID=A0AAN9IEA9_CROPI